ncbi:hypothetical protein VTN49DRAFT_4991 [Thermomyces lanuginosus]|uniref:uncharacterized protein n=1 Tax=Thermomyces lanuginosus TaxID=5541 RepID=UPI00374323C4
MDSTEAPIYSMAVISFAASLSGFLLCISPLICQVSHRNLAASCLIGYMMISDAFYALNALIWSHGDVNSWWDGAGLCDIEVKIQIATQIALPGTLFCIFYTLADVMNTDRATLVPTRAERLRKQALEVTFCFVIPLVAMALHFICQPFRYGILGVTGCAQSFDESWVSFVLVYGWPPVICLLAAVYCVIVVVRLIKYKTEFSRILGSMGNRMNAHRFLRLFWLSSIMILIILPLQTWVFYTQVVAAIPFHPFSWEKVHGPDWNTIVMVDTLNQVQYQPWISVGGSVLLFLFFGLSPESLEMYRQYLVRLGLGRWFPSLNTPRPPTSFTFKFFSRISKGAQSLFSWTASRSIATFASFPSSFSAKLSNQSRSSSDEKQTITPVDTITAPHEIHQRCDCIV